MGGGRAGGRLQRGRRQIQTVYSPPAGGPNFDLAPSGDEVNLRFPLTINPQGQEMTTLVTMKRLSGERDMLAK